MTASTPTIILHVVIYVTRLFGLIILICSMCYYMRDECSYTVIMSNSFTNKLSNICNETKNCDVDTFRSVLDEANLAYINSCKSTIFNIQSGFIAIAISFMIEYNAMAMKVPVDQPTD